MSDAERLSTGQAIARSLVKNGIDTIFGIPGAHTYYFIRRAVRAPATRSAPSSRGTSRAPATWRSATPSPPDAPAPTRSYPAPACSTPAPRCAPPTAPTRRCCASPATSPRPYHIGRGHGILHELPDQLATLRGLTKWAERIDHPTEAPAMVNEAFSQLTSGRPRPVALECAMDVLGARRHRSTCAVPTAVPPPPEPDPDAIARAAALLAGRNNPLIIVGSGAIGARAEVHRPRELLQAPVTSHRSGRGIVGDDTPYGFSIGRRPQALAPDRRAARHRHPTRAAIPALARIPRWAQGRPHRRRSAEMLARFGPTSASSPTPRHGARAAARCAARRRRRKRAFARSRIRRR